ncbi:SpoIIE family protein phosphatase [Streptomyces sp. NPDC005181]|uniref:SpoIIE family protein phosphatase n=1 Tax=Streptomyces sp. NPDC005181 TaxID=3156869 RepID=UPI0033BA1DF5
MNARLALLDSVERGATQGEVLRLALQHAVAELSGLGGTVHLRGPMSALRLVSVAGLPPDLVRPWEIIDQEDTAAPARAVRQGTAVWMLHAPSGTAPPASSDGWPGTGLAAVPVFGAERAERPVGALTVVTGATGEPTRKQWEFLAAVAAWAEERVVQASPPTRPAPEEPSGTFLRQALKAVQVGTWDWNIRTGALAWDDAAMAVYGTAPEDFTPQVESWMKVVHPDDVPWTLAAVEKAIRNRSVFNAEYRVRRLDGSYGWTQARARVVLDDTGEPYRMIGTAWDSNESRSARDALSHALHHMSDGFLSADDDWRITFVNLEAERMLGSSEEELFGRVLWTLPAVQQVTDMEARCRQAAAAVTPASFDVQMAETERCYHLRLVPVPDGVTLYFTDVTEMRRHEAERAAADGAAAERASRITELTAALATATTSRDVVDAVAQRVLPPFRATGLLVQAVEGNQAHNVGAVGYPRAFLERIDGRSRIAADPVWDAISTQGPLFVSSAQEYAARYPALADNPQEIGKQSWAFLPLAASGHTFGICVIAFDQPRRLADEERTLLTAISALVAHALERARLYDAEHTRSQELQHALLPQKLPDLPACTTAARYLPAGQGMDVGGDWYDVIPLSAGRVALVIGDVMGHGLSEAVTMGRLRTAVHTLAGFELPPDEIMSHLNDIVSDLGEDSYATCLYALYDSTTRTCSLTRAGHPPPAVVHPDGTVHFPHPVPDPPLGVAEPPFETVELTMPQGSLLVLYTDGLVESSEREIDQGMTELAQLLRTGGSEDLDRLCETLVVGLLPAGQRTSDDAALLVARVHALSADQMASWPLPEDPRAAGLAREHVREQLSTWGLDDMATTTELLASELVGNVVRHGRGPMQLRLLRGADLVCEVTDGSLTMPRVRHASETDEGGRGLQLVAALSQRWGTRYTATGKCIWTAQPMHGSDIPDPLLQGLGTHAVVSPE